MEEEIKQMFEDWAHEKGFVLDELFMSTDGVPENPYEDSDTELAYEIWTSAIAAYQSKGEE